MTNEELETQRKWASNHLLDQCAYKAMLLDQLVDVERKYRWTSTCHTLDRLQAIISIRKELRQLGESV